MGDVCVGVDFCDGHQCCLSWGRLYYVGHQNLGEEEGEKDQEGEQQPRTGHDRIYETRLGSPGVT